MKNERWSHPVGTREGRDWGKAIPTADHPPRNILMRASVRKPGEVQG